VWNDRHTAVEVGLGGLRVTLELEFVINEHAAVWRIPRGADENDVKTEGKKWTK